VVLETVEMGQQLIQEQSPRTDVFPLYLDVAQTLLGRLQWIWWLLETNTKTICDARNEEINQRLIGMIRKCLFATAHVQWGCNYSGCRWYIDVNWLIPQVGNPSSIIIGEYILSVYPNDVLL